MGDDAQIALVGDLHSAWSEADVDHFNRSGYQLVLFTGDLGASTRRDGAKIAKSISGIERDVLVMPGNNDVPQIATIASELTYRREQRALLAGLDDDLAGAAEKRAPRASLCGYSQHVIELGPRPVTLIAGRPFSMGGPDISFASELVETHGIANLTQSVDRLCALIDGASTRELIFLSHNGPAGLGAERDAPWGNDFMLGGGDWGDPDLAEALLYAHEVGRRVLAVIGGHMHTRLRGGGQRTWKTTRQGVLYLNAARVPRVYTLDNGRPVRHHVALILTETGIAAEERLVDG